MHSHLAGVAVDDLGLLLRVRDYDHLRLPRRQQVPRRERADHAGLAVLSWQRDQLLALRAK
jgi:hypothetical protein